MIFSEKVSQRIRSALYERRKQFSSCPFPTDEELSRLGPDMQEALTYLYAYMPLSDVSNYDMDVFLDYARNALSLRSKNPSVRDMEDDFFGEYILFHRVNTEEIRPCRSFFRELIGDRLDGLDDLTAALEVNHWCAENGTYHADDERTISSLGFFLRGYGRCGEESTFLVNALRSVGIPARQVYVPFWAHTDDNHAWVEFFAGGSWHFTGACEAQPVPDIGWFNKAASRAMLVHSRTYSGYRGGDGFVDQCDISTELNQLHRYSHTRTLLIKVTDKEGRPAEKVKVDIMLFNAAAWRIIATPETDEHGEIRFETGFGMARLRPLREGAVPVDVPACKGDEEQFGIHGETEGREPDDRGAERGLVSRVEIVLDDLKRSGESFAADGRQLDQWLEFHYESAPEHGIAYAAPTAEQRAENAARQKADEKIRLARTASWQNPELTAFRKLMDGMGQEDLSAAKAVLEGLSEKDLTDCPDGILEGHFLAVRKFYPQLPHDVFCRGLASPRVDYEVLTAWAPFFSEAFSPEDREFYRSDPAALWSLIDERVSGCDKEERSGVLTTPRAAWEGRTAGLVSKKVLFVAIARAIGLPAFLRRADKAICYWDGLLFRTLFEEDEACCHLILEKEDLVDQQNMVTGTLARYNRETCRWDEWILEDSWKDNRMETDLPAGSYVLTTGNRLPKGDSYGAEYYFTLTEGEEKSVFLNLRPISAEEMLIHADLPDFHLSQTTGKEWTAQGKKLILWLEAGEEPTEHILNEMYDLRGEYSGFASDILFVLEHREDERNPLLQKVLEAIPGIRVALAKDPGEREPLARSMFLDPGQLPMVFVTDGRLHSVFGSCGYSVGTGTILLKIMRMK